MVSYEKIWLEYEGIGCPEIKYLHKSVEECRLWRIAKENHLLDTTETDITQIRTKLKQLSDQSLNIKNDTEFLALSKHIKSICRTNVEQLKTSGTKNHHNISDLSIDKEVIRLAAAKDCLDGYLSTVTEILIELIYNFKAYNSQKRCTELCEVLMEVLISSQEYEIGKICFEEYILYFGHSDYSKSLHLYIKTIQSKSELDAFGQLINLQRLEEYEKRNKNDELFFLIINQKAFCYAILGDWKKALQEEFNVLSQTSDTFSRYICQLNISRLLINLQLPATAIATLVSAYATIRDLKNQENYQLLLMLYLSRAGHELGIEEKILYERDLSNSTSNWRIAQAMNEFSSHSNYCQLHCFTNNCLSIELTNFQNGTIEVSRDNWSNTPLNQVFQVIEQTKMTTIGAYEIHIINSNQKLGINIKMNN